MTHIREKGRPFDEIYRWHDAAVRGEKPPIHTTPECGWFLLKTGQGSFLPASIYWEPQIDENGERIADDILRAEVGGAQRDPEEIWPYLAKRPVTQYEYLTYLEGIF